MWSCESVCWYLSPGELIAAADGLYRQTCRINFEQPGFSLVNMGRQLNPFDFRWQMVELTRALSRIHQANTGSSLAYVSASRFNQQTNTHAHLDAGPDENILMLGYEPSVVNSHITLLDYAQCAFDMGLTPNEFLSRHNPMFDNPSEQLKGYRSSLSGFSSNDYQILLVNNSSAPYSIDAPAWQGVLHTATIPSPSESEQRVINSTMIAPVPAGTSDVMDAQSLNAFLNAAVAEGY